MLLFTRTRQRAPGLLPRLMGASLLAGLLSCGGGGAQGGLRRVEAPPEAQGAPLATLANNHVLDCGGEGLLRTREVLLDRGFATVGAGEELGEACAPLRLLAGGVDVACLAYLAMPTDRFDSQPSGLGAARWETCAGAAAVAALKSEGAFVVVALHLHLAPSWTSVTAPEHRALVLEVLEAGADLVVAHGPHVPQGILVRDGRIALLSLGNFLCAQGGRLPGAARDVLVARLAVHADQVLLSLAAARQDEQGRPHLAGAADTDRILENLARQSPEEATTLVRHADRAYLLLDR